MRRASRGSRAALGIKRASIDKALETLVASIDVMLEDGKPQLTDPMFGLWLRTRRLTPAAGKDSS